MRPSGPTDAAIMIVGEAPGEEEIRKGLPFVGPSGWELDRMLQDAGFSRTQCFVTNVTMERPQRNEIEFSRKTPAGWLCRTKARPDGDDWQLVNGYWCRPPIVRGLERLQKEIALVKPRLIIGLGNLVLWALTGKWGITDWRGSTIEVSYFCPENRKAIFVPTYHPAAILRQYSWRLIAVHDLRRAERVLREGLQPPAYSFRVRSTFAETLGLLDVLQQRLDAEPTVLAVDIETRWGHIACLGLAWSRREALCIPFMCVERRDGYWTLDEEAEIVMRLARLLTHPNARCVGQNFLYDVQYIFRSWHFIPRFHSDTMLAHHVCWPGFPKGLDFLSSMYCDYHLFWKAESKEWHKSMQEDILWTYNCKDCVITFECHEEIATAIDSMGLRPQYETQMQLWRVSLKSMIRGVRVNAERREALRAELSAAIARRNADLELLLGHPINIKSPLQMKRLFYEDLGFTPYRNRKTGEDTLNDEALEKLVLKEPLLDPLVSRIRELRSLGVFLGTFIEAKPDSLDGRMRFFINPAGTETFRFSSTQDAFGSGMNMQNIPAGDE